MHRRPLICAAERTAALGILGFALIGCTTVSVPPAPIDPVITAQMLKARSLQDPEIAASLSRMGLAPGGAWSLDALTVAAWNLRSDIAVAAADVAEGMAAERVAGLRPNPTVGFDPSYFLTNALEDPSQWVLAAALNFTIETAGKREIRISQAQADTETRRWRLAEVYWQARAELRRALIARALATENVALANDELALRADYLDWVETQIRFGLGIGADRLTAQSNLSRAQTQLRVAINERAVAEAQIAAALGIPIENLPLMQLAELPLASLPQPETYDLGALRDMAILNRLSVRHALADYAVTEQALRLAVARQYPDISIGPGYTYDRGDHAITLATAAIVPLLHDESDAIAQAVDVRSRAAAQFQQAQSLALTEIDTAAARYRTAYSTLPQTRDGEDIARRTVDEVLRRLNAGGADRGEVLTARIGLALAQRASFDALRTVADALGALEDAAQRPIFPPSMIAVTRPGDPNPESLP